MFSLLSIDTTGSQQLANEHVLKMGFIVTVTQSTCFEMVSVLYQILRCTCYIMRPLSQHTALEKRKMLRP